MGSRYIALLEPTDDMRMLLNVRGDLGLVRLCDHPRLLVLAERGGRTILLDGARGAIVGPIFDRGSTTSLARLDAHDQTAICASKGAVLTERYWGGYIALLAPIAGAGAQIVRAPLGDLPCLFIKSHDSLIAASDIALLRMFEPAGWAIDWNEVIHHLAVPDLRRPSTCLDGVDELQGGSGLDFEMGGLRTEELWSPWSAIERFSPIFDRQEAQRAVRSAIDLSVVARSSAAGRILLRLSGGLDSSIIAASLAGAGRDVVALTMITNDRSGDERHYAAAVASAFSHPLVEMNRAIDWVDPEISFAAGLPRPATRLFMQDSIKAAARAAFDCDARIVFDGGGGDNVFCLLQSVAPVVDRFRHEGIGSGLGRTMRDISILTETPVGSIALRALRRAARHSPGYRWSPERSFLMPAPLGNLSDQVRHSWLQCPSGALPGKAAHIALLVSAQSWVESLDPMRDPASVSPLLSQPVIEACLRVPSWMWFDQGRNRVIAREAYRGDLPAEIIDRTSKGAPDSFLGEIFEAHRATIRAMLLDGKLREQGIIDPEAVDRAMKPGQPLRGYDFLRLLHLNDAEAWLRSAA